MNEHFINFLNAIDYTDVYDLIVNSIDCTREQPPIRPIDENGNLVTLPNIIDIVSRLGMYKRIDSGIEKYRIICRQGNGCQYVDKQRYDNYYIKETVFPDSSRVFDVEIWMEKYNSFIDLVAQILWIYISLHPDYVEYISSGEPHQ